MAKGVQCWACIGKRTGEILSVKMDKDTADDAAGWLRVTHRGGVSVVPAIVMPVEKKPRHTRCPDCLGRGEKRLQYATLSGTRMETCKTCGGTGKKPRKRTNNCQACLGRGQIVSHCDPYHVEHDPCGACGGTGKKPKRKAVRK